MIRARLPLPANDRGQPRGAAPGAAPSLVDALAQVAMDAVQPVYAEVARLEGLAARDPAAYGEAAREARDLYARLFTTLLRYRREGGNVAERGF